MPSDKKNNELIEKRNKATHLANEKAFAKQQKLGKMTARNRINYLLDENSFQEYDMFARHEARDFGMAEKELPCDGVITGIGTIHGRHVCVFAQDFAVAGGSLGLMHARKITKIIDYAIKMQMPVIELNDSGGARLQEGVNSLAGYGDIFYANIKASGVVPQISVVLGACAGGAVYSPALTDFVFVVDGISKMFITGSNVIKTVLGEEISMEELGGAKVNCEKNGNAHFLLKTEQEALDKVRELLTFMPQNNGSFPPKLEPEKPDIQININGIIPDDPKEPYDVRAFIKAVTDGSYFFEVHENWAENIVVGFARIQGNTVGVVANQPNVLAGVIDVDSADKSSRFIRFCDAFNIPILTFVDIPGFLPGIDQEHSGIIRHGAKLLYAYGEATVPKITLILRKAYGCGYVAMNSRHIGADFVFALPTAEIAVMGAEGAVNLIFKKEISSAEDSEKVRQQKINDYKAKFSTPYIAAEKGYIDAVIKPEEVREVLVHAIEVSKNKTVDLPNRKHGISPV